MTNWKIIAACRLLNRPFTGNYPTVLTFKNALSTVSEWYNVECEQNSIIGLA